MPSVYDIMVALNLDDKASEGLKGIGESFTKLSEQLETVTEGFHGLSAAIMGGAGVGLLLGLEKLTSGADELATSLTKVKLAGGDMDATLMAARRATEAVPGTTTGQNVELLRRLSAILGEQNVLAMSPDLARAAWYLEFYKKDPEAALTAMAQQARARRLGGQQTAEFINEQIKTLQAAGGQIDPARMALFQQRMGAAGITASEDFITKVAPALVMAMPGSRSAMGLATNLAALEESMVRGPQGKKGTMRGIDMHAWQSYVSGPGGFMPGRDMKAALLAENPYEWAQTFAKGFIDKYGNDPQFLTKTLEKLFTPHTAALMATMMLQGRAIMGEKSPIEEFMRRQAGAPGVRAEDQEAITRTAPEWALKRIQADLKEFLETIGDATMERRLAVLSAISEHLESFNRALRHLQETNPEVIPNIATALGGLGTAMIALAAIRIPLFLLGVTAGSAPIVIAATALAAALAIFGGFKAENVDSILTGITDAVSKFIARMKGEAWHMEQAGPGLHKWWQPDVMRRQTDTEERARQQTVIDAQRRTDLWRTYGGPMAPTGPGLVASAYPRLHTLDVIPPTAPGFDTGPRIVSGPAPPTGPYPAMMQPGIPLPFLGIGGPSGGMGAGGVPYTFTPPAPGSAAMPASFSPQLPRSEQNANLNVQFNVDGRTLGSVILQRILSMYDFSQTGSGANWEAGFPNLDNNYSSR